MRGVLLAEVAPDWLLEQMDAEWADRYQKRFSDFRLPKDATERVALAETIGADGRQLEDTDICRNQSSLAKGTGCCGNAAASLAPALPCQPARHPLSAPMENSHHQPCSSLLLTMSKHVIVGRKARAFSGYKVHFTEMCETNEPHLIVDVITTAATTPDGEIMEELHEQLAQQEMLPAQHLVDMGYVDAEVLAESQSRYQVEVVGPVMPDVSWQTKAATGFDHRQFTIDWQAHQVTCPTSHTSQSWGTISDRHGKPVIRVRFPQAVCQACPFHDQCTHSPARVLILQPNEQAYRALQEARVRELTPEFRVLYAKRAGVEGTMAQAVRTCEMRRARYIGSKKLRLQAFFTATAMNVLRACAWMEEGIHASTPVSRFARLVASAKSVA